MGIGGAQAVGRVGQRRSVPVRTVEGRSVAGAQITLFIVQDNSPHAKPSAGR